MSITRNSHYQEGSIERVRRAKGSDVWVYRWRETRRDGSRVQKKRVVGDVERLPTQSSAKRAVEQLRVQINADREAVGHLNVAEAWEHFQAHELHNPVIDRSPTTIDLYLNNFRHHIIPRWGKVLLRDVKAVAVEAWLKDLSLAAATKCKLRNHLSALFSHAIRYELFDRMNPITSVRQSAKREEIPDILSLREVHAILSEIAHPEMRLMVLIAAVTALRRSEIRGLKWSDLDFDKLFIRLKRGKVNRHQTKLKTEASRKGVTMPQELADAFLEWRRHSLYRAEGDWVFASVRTSGLQPVWLEMVLRNHVRPAAQRAGIEKKIGWHTFRRSVSSVLGEMGEPVKVVSDLLRHANTSITELLYQQSSADAKRSAQDRLKGLFAPAA